VKNEAALGAMVGDVVVQHLANTAGNKGISVSPGAHLGFIAHTDGIGTPVSLEGLSKLLVTLKRCCNCHGAASVGASRITCSILLSRCHLCVRHVYHLQWGL
jgi:hypothetical protein